MKSLGTEARKKGGEENGDCEIIIHEIISFSTSFSFLLFQRFEGGESERKAIKALITIKSFLLQ
jgi:hypothetical protein